MVYYPRRFIVTYAEVLLDGRHALGILHQDQSVTYFRTQVEAAKAADELAKHLRPQSFVFVDEVLEGGCVINRINVDKHNWIQKHFYAPRP
jgi:hypothetical protein